MTHKPSNLLTVGQLTGVFGIKGWVKVKSWTEPTEQILQYSPWWMKTRHGVKEMKVMDFQQRPQGLVVQFEGIEDRTQAEELGRIEIAVDKQQLADLDEGDFYWYQLQGLQVISHYEGEVYRFGVVDKILETGANDVLVVKASEGSMDARERLVPYVPGQYIHKVDLQAGVIEVEWDPEF